MANNIKKVKRIKVIPTFNYRCPSCKTNISFVLTSNIPLNKTSRLGCNKCGKQFNITLKRNRPFPVILEIIEIP